MSQLLDPSEDDQRFAEILRPIKDLTTNWEVPLSRYLEDYIGELHELQINLDGRPGARVNFTEAALILQVRRYTICYRLLFLGQPDSISGN